MAAADNDNTTGGGDSFKPQLDQAAIDQRNRDADTKPNPIVEKSEQCHHQPVLVTLC